MKPENWCQICDTWFLSHDEKNAVCGSCRTHAAIGAAVEKDMRKIEASRDNGNTVDDLDELWVRQTKSVLAAGLTKEKL